MDIRKISIGIDLKNSLHYVLGQRILNDEYEIHLIKNNVKTNTYQIFIINKKQEIVIWKEYNNNMPVSIEYNINF